MSKRFTETAKWDDPWFRKLSPSAKLLWSWLTDKCDAAGIVDPDLELASFQIGLPITESELKELGSRLEKIERGKYIIPGFISFQVGEPSRECRAHKPIFTSLEKHKMERVLNEYPNILDTVQDKDKDKDRKEGVGGNHSTPPTEEEVMRYTDGCAQVMISKSCALRWMTDRETSDWTRPKGLHMIPVLPNWQADLRGYAQDWNKREAEKKARSPNGSSGKNWHPPTGV